MTEGERQAPPLLRRCTVASRHPVEVRRLAAGTAVQVVRAFGELVVQVSHLLDPRDRAAAARHAVEHHDRRCRVDDCFAARGWLRRPVPVPGRARLSVVGA